MTPTISSIGLARMSLFVLAGLLFFLHAVAAQSQQSGSGNASDDVWAGVEEMVVSGSTAGGILADVARSNSVTAFSSQDLEAIGAADISDIANFTPNLEIVVAGSTSPTFFIRGIGLNDFNANAAGAVAIYQDDVPLNSPALQLGSLFDVENAAVLRGPQGTGPFRNASAGAIKVYSRKPTGDFGVSFKSEFGNYDSRDFEGSLQFPVTDETLWARFSFRVSEREGTFRNRCAGAPSVENRLTAPGRTNNPPYSYCKENILGGNQSTVDPNQPKWLNSRDNWAARAIFLIQPDLPGDIDMDWLFTARGGRRDEPSFVGQAIGTSGKQRFYDDNGQEITEDGIDGVLGGTDQGGYTDPDITNVLDKRTQSNVDAGFNLAESQSRARNSLSYDLAKDLDQDPYAGNISHAGGTTNDTYGFSLKGNIEIGDVAELMLISGYDNWEREVDVDLDFSPNTLFEIDTQDEGHQVFQELRLTGQAFEGLDEIFGGPLDWEVGAFVLHEDLDVRVDIDLGEATGFANAPKAREYNQKVTSIAGYASASWDFWDAFTLDGGLRFNWERREIDYKLFIVAPTPFEQNDTIDGQEPTGTIRLTYRPTEESSFYLKYTHGWKSGTFNATGSKRSGVSAVDPEKIDAFEAGLRASYFDNRFNLTMSIFHYAYQNYQLFTAKSVFQRPPEFVILNASNVELYGSEVEATILPWEGGLFDIKFAWLEGEFLKFVQTQFTEIPIAPNINITTLQEIDNSGNRLLNAPQYSVALTLQQSMPLGRFGKLVARWDGSWKDDTFFDATEGRGTPNIDDEIFLPQHTIGQKSYWLHNIRLAYFSPDEMFDIALWVRNVANESYKVFSADLASFQQTTLHFVGDPRTYGVSTSVRF